MTSTFEDEFEIKGNLARCRFCAGSTFVKLSNARIHSQSKKHKFSTRNLPTYPTLYLPAKDDLISFMEPDPPDNMDCVPSESYDIIPSPPTTHIPLLSIHPLTNETEDGFDSILQEFENLGIRTTSFGEEMAPDTGISPWSFDLETEEGQDEEEYKIFNYKPKKYVCGQGDWAPYPTKAMFLTDLLFNSPRLRFSEAQKKAILQWGRDLGASDMPKYHALKMFQNELNVRMGNPTTEKVTRNGNLFYLNDIGSLIAKDFSNPNVRPYMNFYPERSNNISQMWHASKWHTDLSADYKMPMAIHPRTGAHFYVGELCQTFSNRLFIPTCWFQLGGNNICCVGFDVSVTEVGLVVQQNNEFELQLIDLQHNYLQLTQSWKPIFAECSAEFSKSMPNMKRSKAEGRPFFFVYTMIFIDDVSGNVSKQWNKHYVCYMSNCMLPREHIDKESNVQYVASSPSVNALELAQGIRESFEKSQEGVIAYDCVLRQEIMIEVIPFLIAADNPMHAELTSSCSLTANKFCRTCDVGGPQQEKISDDGYLKLFKTGNLRVPAVTRKVIMQQYLRALQPNPRSGIEDIIKENGVKDILAQPLIQALMDLSYSLYATKLSSSEEIQETLNAELRKIRSEGRIQNAFLEMKELNVHLDTPTEILHTVLLGIIKYFWGQTAHLVIKDKKFDIFQARLQSISSDGLSVPQIMASYLCQYRGALIGKHFKTIVQIMPFIIYDLVHQDLLDAWSLMGRLAILCWHTNIPNLELYLDELEDIIEQFLTKTAICAPSIIVSKPKFHFLVHLPLYIRRFGPALLFSTEKFESKNSVFRSSSVHSNHLAPSRDIATSFAQLDRVKHITSGGWWYDDDLKKYVCASSHIPNFILGHQEYAKLVGLYSPSTKPAGTMIMDTKQVSSGKNERVLVPYSQTLAARIQQDNVNSMSSPIVLGKSIIVQNGDLAKIGSAVIIKKKDVCKIALVLELFNQQNETKNVSTIVTVQIFKLGTRRHNLLDLPLLQKTDECCILSPLDLLCVVNIQHDCSSFRCQATGTKSIYQERQQTMRMHKTVHHIDNQNFLLNCLSLHNHQEIQLFLAQSVLPMRKYFNPTEHSDIRRQKAAQLRDKKQQAKDDKMSKERDALLGRTTKGECSQKTGVSLETGVVNNALGAGALYPSQSQVVITESDAMDASIDPSLLPGNMASTNATVPPCVDALMESNALIQPPEPKKQRKQTSKNPDPQVSCTVKKTSNARSGKKQDMLGLGSSTGIPALQRKRGKTKLTSAQITANEEMLTRDIFDI